VTCFLAFDVLAVDGREVMAESWTDRRKRLEDIGAVLDSKRIAVVPVTDDAAQLRALWVGHQGGEGIVRSIQHGESLAYVRDQMGHHSIKITVDIYGHRVPGANKAAVDRLDAPGRNLSATGPILTVPA
jgi:integrase